MLLQSLELESIRSYRSARIEFPKGRTLLSGDIGAGKSTVLLAIEFALFGLVRGWNEGSKLLRHGATRGRVRLEADIDGPITIERSLKRTSNGIQQEDVLVVEDSVERTITPSEARALIITRLGYPPEFITKQPLLFRYTVFTPQESMKSIIDERPDVRLDAIRKIFGIDRYERIASNAQTVAREVRSHVSVLAGKLERKPQLIEELTRIAKQRIELEKELKDAREKVERANSAFEKHAKDLEDAHKSVEREEAKRETSKRLSEEKETLSEELERLIAERSNLEAPQETRAPDTDALENEIIALDEKLHVLDETLEAAREERSSREKLHVELTGRIDRSNEHIEQLSAHEEKRIKLLEEVKDLRERFERFDAQAVRSRVTKLSDSLDELMQERTRVLERIRSDEEQSASMPASGACPVCGQDVDEAHRTRALERSATRIERERERLTTIEARTKELTQERETLEKRLGSYEQLESQLESLPDDESEALEKERAARDKLTANLNELSGKLSSLVERIESLADERTKLVAARADAAKRLKAAHAERMRIERAKRAIERRAAIDERTAAIRTRLEHIETQMPKIDAQAIERLEIAKREHAQALERLQTLRGLSERLGERLVGLDDRRNALKEELEALKALSKSREEHEAIASFLVDPVPDLTRQIESEVMRRILIETNDRFSKWFSILIEDLEGYLDASFSPVIVQSGYDVSFDNLSGGERTSVALAFRLALHESINHLTGQSSTGLLILDEPTEGFSTEQLDSVRDVLRELNSEQIIIVSHEEKVEGFVDRTIRIDKTENESTIT